MVNIRGYCLSYRGAYHFCTFKTFLDLTIVLPLGALKSSVKTHTLSLNPINFDHLDQRILLVIENAGVCPAECRHLAGKKQAL